MQALADTFLTLVLGLAVITVAGDELARFVNDVAVPTAGLLAAAIVARLVWFYTSRW